MWRNGSLLQGRIGWWRSCPVKKRRLWRRNGIFRLACPEGDREKGLLVIGADTVVALDGAILGKPVDREDAVTMLERLQGREHAVYTGVTLLYRAADAPEWIRKCFHERSKVYFFPMTKAEIAEYVKTGDPMDKAGAYGIQGAAPDISAASRAIITMW